MGSPEGSKALAELGLVAARGTSPTVAQDMVAHKALVPCATMHLGTANTVVFRSCSHQAVAARTSLLLMPDPRTPLLSLGATGTPSGPQLQRPKAGAKNRVLG